MPLGAVVTIVGLASSFVAPFLPLYLTNGLHAGPGRASLFLFLMPLAAVVVASVVARFSDRPGLRPRILVSAAIAGVIGFGLFALLRNYWAALIIALTLVAAAGAMMPQAFAFSRVLLDRTQPTRAAAGVNALRSLLSLAWVAGPPLAAYLIVTIDFRGLYLVAALMHLVLLPVLFRFGRVDSTAAPRAADERTGGSAVEPSSRQLLVTTVAFVLLQCAANLGVMTMPLFISTNLGGDIADAGAALGLCAAIEIPLMLLFGALAIRRPLRSLVLLGGFFGIAYFAVMTLTQAVWQVAAAQLLNAGFIAAAMGLGISYFQDLLPSRLGQATTMFTNSHRLGAMLAGLIVGAAQLVGYRMPYAVGAAMCIAGVALLVTTRGSRPQIASRPGRGHR